jgi:hypothetical protein
MSAPNATVASANKNKAVAVNAAKANAAAMINSGVEGSASVATEQATTNNAIRAVNAAVAVSNNKNASAAVVKTTVNAAQAAVVSAEAIRKRNAPIIATMMNSYGLTREQLKAQHPELKGLFKGNTFKKGVSGGRTRRNHRRRA